MFVSKLYLSSYIEARSLVQTPHRREVEGCDFVVTAALQSLAWLKAPINQEDILCLNNAIAFLGHGHLHADFVLTLLVMYLFRLSLLWLDEEAFEGHGWLMLMHSL